MNNIFKVPFILVWCCYGASVFAQDMGVNNAQKKAPNILFILIDDQGWTDLATPMDSTVEDSSSDYYETPNIDALAQRSLRFSSGYAPSPICSPSRASFLTGKSPQVLGLTDIAESRPGSRRYSDLYTGKKMIGPQPKIGLPDEEITIAEFIRERVEQDYATGHFGKWHVGGGGPARHGFEAHDGSTGNHNVSAHSDDPNPKDVFGVTGRAIAFMEAQVYSGRPFFLQVSHYANHVPLSAMHDTIEKYRAKDKGERHTNPVYAALNEDLDSSIGRLIESLQELGIDDNTYIFYVSDNGGSKNKVNPSTNNAPLREGKTWVYEGGTRVPFMVSGPEIAAGENAVPVIGWDLFPTFCAILDCQGDMPKDVEGGNLLPILHGDSKDVERLRGEALVWHFPHYLSAKGTTPQSAIRVGEYKLIKFYHHERVELYDLVKDIGETTNIADLHPEIASSLENQLDDYLAEIDAGMPVKNQVYLEPSSEQSQASADYKTSLSLEGSHRSVFSRINYRIPKGWVVTDGESDWLAPSMEKQFWQPTFDPALDSYYVVSAIPPFLTLADRQQQRARSLEDVLSATVHSLKVANGATLIDEPEFLNFDGKKAVRFVLSMDDTQSHYQILVNYAPNKIATVAASGPHSERNDMRELVTAIASTITP